MTLLFGEKGVMNGFIHQKEEARPALIQQDEEEELV
jgi:hypothetical protein